MRIVVMFVGLWAVGCGGGEEAVRPASSCREAVSSYVYLEGSLPTTHCREGEEDCAPRGDGMVECKCMVPCQ
jgi:hypothetical protein